MVPQGSHPLLCSWRASGSRPFPPSPGRSGLQSGLPLPPTMYPPVGTSHPRDLSLVDLTTFGFLTSCIHLHRTLFSMEWALFSIQLPHFNVCVFANGRSFCLFIVSIICFTWLSSYGSCFPIYDRVVAHVANVLAHMKRSRSVMTMHLLSFACKPRVRASHLLCTGHLLHFSACVTFSQLIVLGLSIFHTVAQN